MAYMEDQALARDDLRAKLLANMPQIDPRAFFASGEVAPKPVDVTPPQPLGVVPVMGARGGVRAAEPQKQDNTLANAFGMLTNSSGLKDLIQRLQADREKGNAPSSSAKTGGSSGGGGASTYYGSTTPGSGAVSSPTLAAQRANIAKELDGSPATRLKLATLMLAEEGGDSDARVALAESAMNRNVANNMGSMEKTLNPGYYAPFKDGGYARAAQRLANDPKLLAQINSEIDKAAKGGSNISNFATDNGSGSVAESARRNQTVAYEAANKELFSRKEGAPHGDWGVNGKAWYERTAPGVQRDAKVAPVTAQQAPAEMTSGQPIETTKRGMQVPSATQADIFNPKSTGVPPVAAPQQAAAPPQGQGQQAALPPEPQVPAQQQAVAPQPQVQVQKTAPAETPVAPPAPAPQAPAAPKLVGTPPPPPAAPKADLAGLHKWFDGNVVAGINELMPGQGSNVPLMGRGLSVRGAAKMAPTEQIKPLIDAAAKKYGVTPKQLMEEVAKPPPAEKRSELEGERPVQVAQADTTATNYTVQPREGPPQATRPPGNYQEVAQPIQAEDRNVPQATVTPEMGKALLQATQPEKVPTASEAAPPPPPPMPPPSQPGQPAPTISPATGQTSSTAPGAVVMPNAPMPVQTAFEPSTMPAGQSPFGMWQPPIPWDTLQGWGWSGGGAGSEGFDTGGFNLAGGEGFTGFDGFIGGVG